MKKLIVLGFLIVFSGVTYLCDYAWFRYRADKPQQNDPFESVQYFVATQLKNGKMEVFFGQPGTEVCVHSLFPHAGDRPCWIVKQASNKMRVE